MRTLVILMHATREALDAQRGASRRDDRSRLLFRDDRDGSEREGSGLFEVTREPPRAPLLTELRQRDPILREAVLTKERGINERGITKDQARAPVHRNRRAPKRQRP